MPVTIRPLEGRDVASVVALSLRAWEPVFDSLRAALGEGLFARMHPDWRQDQRRAVEEACADGQLTVWVAEVDGDVVGFVATRTDAASRLGEIHMVAVAPEHQRQGIGGALTRVASDQLAEAGMAVAMVETGGDPGHAPARATYEQAGFTLLPIARYFKVLEPSSSDPMG
jgi:ribosomal protein S18 acetylase RimI-like enzyme